MENLEGLEKEKTKRKKEYHKPLNKKTIRKKLNSSKYLLILFAPVLLYYLIFHYVPMFGIVIAFKDYNLFKGVLESEWVGLKYFQMFIESPDFFNLLRNTFLLGLYNFIFGFPIPIIFALLLNELKNMYFKRFVQTLSYLPHFISNVVVASMVVVFLSPSGIINRLISFLGIEPLNWMIMPEMFRTIFVTSEIWQHMGWEAIIYLAALTSISPQLYEAAEIDGAGRFAKLWYITLPGILPAIFIVGILNIGKVLEIGFEKVFLLYNPVTYETADIISTYVYRVGLVQGNYSYATAIGLFLGVISFIFLFGANYLSKRFGQESLW
ncbi:sugar ABC transporter permease [Virgibacillus profundi]|uniref:Sugar ABC transporter permease n=1 Tax=Virgibacillus profundi TaxID=2024555 RepID=A0A2A2IJH8_9BACI|nr:ABC transporter permease subunit [Virgibacillus profundi]PAV31255.1 sugar ABC transporter permease [Virgibacillus profundi]PXY55440.1 sugar ABC transporter permease [Virgibacillus profundi]